MRGAGATRLRKSRRGGRQKRQRRRKRRRREGTTGTEGTGRVAVRTMRQVAKRVAIVVALAGALAAGNGCVAFNVGRPEIDVHKIPVTETEKTPFKTEVVAVNTKAQVEGNRLSAWLDADVKEEFRQWEHIETTTTTMQKRFSVGLFPGAADLVYRPRGESSKLGMFAKHEVAWLLMGLGILPLVSTIETLVVEPFTGWHNDCDAGWKRVDAQLAAPIADKHYQSHLGLIGIHKSLRTTQTGPVRERPNRDVGVESRRRTVTIGGPYEVELRLNVPREEDEGKTRVVEWGMAEAHRDGDVVEKATVGAGSTMATFTLPEVSAGGLYTATLTFRSLYTGPDAVKGSWQTRTLKQQVWLQEKPRPKPMAPAYVPPRYTPPPVDKNALVDEIVDKLKREAQERKPEGPPYTVEKTMDGTGKTVWRVRMREDQNAFGVDSEVKPKILQELRDDFAGRHPEVPRGEINAWASYTTEKGGRTLVYVGVAESLIPELESLEYNAETHRGTVRMRLRAGPDLRRSKEFVRQNISAIVCDKNVALTAGERPPDGANYLSLDANYSKENGLLTVEFEAEE